MELMQTEAPSQVKRYVRRAISLSDRLDALSVIHPIYQHEKGWIHGDYSLFPIEDLFDVDVSWFVAYEDFYPVGVLCLHYHPSLAYYDHYGLRFIHEGTTENDFRYFLETNTITDIGRFAISKQVRGKMEIPLRLMQAATAEAVTRGCTHFLTDVFKGEPSSPHDFHIRILGFEPIAVHDTDELNSPYPRVMLCMDLKKAYLRLRKANNRIFRWLTEGWAIETHERLLNQTIGVSS